MRHRVKRTFSDTRICCGFFHNKYYISKRNYLKLQCYGKCGAPPTFFWLPIPHVFPVFSTMLSLEFLTVTLPRATRIYQKWTAQMLTYLYLCRHDLSMHRACTCTRCMYACAYRRKHRCETRAAENSIASSTNATVRESLDRAGDDGTRAVIYGELCVLLVRLHRPRACVPDKATLFS